VEAVAIAVASIAVVVAAISVVAVENRLVSYP
jgi:hypothetical protein